MQIVCIMRFKVHTVRTFPSLMCHFFPAKDETFLSVPGRCNLLEILTSSILVFRIQSMFNLFLLFNRGAIGFHCTALSVKSWRQFFLRHKRSVYPVVQRAFFLFFLTVTTSYNQHLWRKLDSNFSLVMRTMRL